VSAASATEGEVAVVGLARSGRAAAALLAARGAVVYASDTRNDPEMTEAAELLRSRGVDVDVGNHDLKRIRAAARVVVSPGIPPSAPVLQAARDAGVPIVSEVAVALAAIPGATVVAVTGTNGKSTTTALVAHLLTTLGHRAAAAGNIGTPLCEIAMRELPPEWIALEISSFQLHDTPGFAPAVGVLTNLSADHLDRYADVGEYYADKMRFFAAATDQSCWVTNADDADSQHLVTGVAGSHYRFSLSSKTDGWYDRQSRQLRLVDEVICDRDDVPLLGDHNVANALAAMVAVSVADSTHQDAAARARLTHGLRTFRGLPHRLEVVAEINEVEWINDSKATNVASARVAIEAMTRPTILLLGGRHKGERYTRLVQPVRDRVRRVIAYGEAAPAIIDDLSEIAERVEAAHNDMADVVSRARAVAQPGDAVLLAPACSSYDMFRDYEDRGERFRSLVSEQ
jgi:UDP-N-acetylmuramoylalanine--D-glutamate ligase